MNPNHLNDDFHISYSAPEYSTQPYLVEGPQTAIQNSRMSRQASSRYPGVDPVFPNSDHVGLDQQISSFRPNLLQDSVAASSRLLNMPSAPNDRPPSTDLPKKGQERKPTQSDYSSSKGLVIKDEEKVKALAHDIANHVEGSGRSNKEELEVVIRTRVLSLLDIKTSPESTHSDQEKSESEKRYPCTRCAKRKKTQCDLKYTTHFNWKSHSVCPEAC